MVKRPYTDDQKRFAEKLSASDLRRIRAGQYRDFGSTNDKFIDANNLIPYVRYHLIATDAYALAPSKNMFDNATYLVRYVPACQDKDEKLYLHFASQFEAARSVYLKNDHQVDDVYISSSSYVCRICGARLDGKVVAAADLPNIQHEIGSNGAVILPERVHDKISVYAGDVSCDDMCAGKFVVVYFFGDVGLYGSMNPDDD